VQEARNTTQQQKNNNKGREKKRRERKEVKGILFFLCHPLPLKIRRWAARRKWKKTPAVCHCE
jgi:hypothetical protein